MNGKKNRLIALGLSAVLLMGSAAAISGGVYSQGQSDEIALNREVATQGLKDDTGKEVGAIILEGSQTQTTYHPYEAFNAKGLYITVYYGDGTRATIDHDFVTWTFSPKIAPTTGNQEATYRITANYYGQSHSRDCVLDLVENATLDSKTFGGSPDVLDYYIEDAWDYSGFYVDLAYSDGYSTRIESDLLDITYRVYRDSTWTDVASPSAVGIGNNQLVFAFLSYGDLSFDALHFRVNITDHTTSVYNYAPGTSTAKPLSGTSAGTFAYGGVDWTYFTTGGSVTDFASGKGIAFEGSCTGVTLFSEAFMSNGDTLISRVTVGALTSTSNSGYVYFGVYVNGTRLGSSLQFITDELTTYAFDLDTPCFGSVEIVFGNAIPGDDPFYLNSIGVTVSTDDTGDEIVPAVQALEEIKTCEVTAGSSSFATYLDNYKTVVETYESELSDIQIRDYADGDTAYSGNRTQYVNFMDKYNACYERYNDTSSSLLYIAGGGETMVAIAVAALAILLSAGASYVIIRKKRAA